MATCTECGIECPQYLDKQGHCEYCAKLAKSAGTTIEKESAFERVKLAGVVASPEAIRGWIDCVGAGTVLESTLADIREVCEAF